LTGNLQPNPAIVARADELGVTVMLVPDNTIETVEAVEKVFGKTRIGQPEKLAQFEAILGSHIDTARLFTDLGA
jgi:BioD-like phosphotransacetylase family protein